MIQNNGKVESVWNLFLQGNLFKFKVSCVHFNQDVCCNFLIRWTVESKPIWEVSLANAKR